MQPAISPVRATILDLYDNEPNEGMRALRELLTAADGSFFGVPLTFDTHETRYKAEAPGLDYDVYLSSGGPGSPFDGEGKAWEKRYFDWLDSVVAHNERGHGSPKFVLFICHSFQMMARFFGFASVVPRRSPSFGIVPVHPTKAGKADVLLRGLPDPFYGADFRSWQVVQPRVDALRSMGASVLAIEKARPHIPLERALMAVRISPHLVGTQFHPEADPPGMSRHFRSDQRRDGVIRKVGLAKYEQILERLEDPDYLKVTHDTVVPRFLRQAVAVLRPEAVAATLPEVGAATLPEVGAASYPAVADRSRSRQGS